MATKKSKNIRILFTVQFQTESLFYHILQRTQKIERFRAKENLSLIASCPTRREEHRIQRHLASPAIIFDSVSPV